MATRSTHSARRLPTGSTPSLERLESRACMAGDVTVAVDSSMIRILGDDVANQIQVDQVTPNLVRVTGLEGTTVNGLVAAIVPLDGKELRIDLKGGDDLLRTDDFNGQPLIVQRLKIEMGDGLDRVELDETQVLGTSDVAIRLARNDQAAKDVLTIDDAVFNGNVMIVTGGGDDVVDIDDAEFKKDLNIEAAAGNDDVSLNDVEVGRDLRITTQDGDDEVAVVDTDVLRDLKIETGKGNDAVEAGRDFDFLTVARNVAIAGGDGDDTISVAAPSDDVVIGGDLTVAGGAGNDDIAVGGGNAPVVVAGVIRIDGGAGNDTALLEEVSAREVTVDFRDGLSDLRANGVGVSGKATFKAGSGVHVVNINGLTATEVNLGYANGKTTADMTAVTAGKLAVTTGNEADTVHLRQSAVRRFFAQLGRGDDVLTADQIASSKMEIDAGDGNDTVDMKNVFVFVKDGLKGDLTIRGRNGDDRVTLDVVAAASALLDGGAGNDTLDEVNTLFAVKTVKDFEVT